VSACSLSSAPCTHHVTSLCVVRGRLVLFAFVSLVCVGRSLVCLYHGVVCNFTTVRGELSISIAREYSIVTTCNYGTVYSITVSYCL
jgi:hypothetical protein